VLKLQLRNFQGQVLLETEHKITVKANSCTLVYSYSLDTILEHNPAHQVFLIAVLQEGVDHTVRRLIYFTSFKEIDFPYAQIQKQIIKTAAGWNIRLTSDVLAKNVFLETDEMDEFFSNNFFDIVPGEPVDVEYAAASDQTDLEKALKITVLNNIYPQ